MKSQISTKEPEEIGKRKIKFSNTEEMIKFFELSDILPTYKDLIDENRIVDSLVRMRLKKKITQDELAKKMGVKQCTISKIENNSDDDLKLKVVKQYANALGDKIQIELIPKTASHSYHFYLEKANSSLAILCNLIDGADPELDGSIINNINDGLLKLVKGLESAKNTLSEKKFGSPNSLSKKNNSNIKKTSEASEAIKKSKRPLQKALG